VQVAGNSSALIVLSGHQTSRQKAQVVFLFQDRGFVGHALGNIGHKSHRKGFPRRPDIAETDVGEKLGPVFSLCLQVQPQPHRSLLRLLEIALPVLDMHAHQRLRKKYLDRLAQQFIRGISQNFLRSRIYHDDLSGFVDNEDGLCGSFEQGPRCGFTLLLPLLC
jgi:hypothetical protein